MTDAQYEALYLDWFNNFLTVQAFATWHHLTEQRAVEIIERGRLVNHSKN